MYVLGIETSCDETAAAVVTGDKQILSNIVLTQFEEHRPYGGVVPEIAARAHIAHLDSIVDKAMKEAGIGYHQLAAVAATGGPGLIGGVMVGVMMGKAIASLHKKPFLAINHLEGHALTARLTSDLAYPFLLLLVSGGHCALIVVEEYGSYDRIGTTKDDALGEAFDKVAKMLGLGYPGGPKVEQWAKNGDAKRFSLPRSLLGTAGYDFSFSGLKTAVSRLVATLEKPLVERDVADVCASFQFTVGEILNDRVGRAMDYYAQDIHRQKTLVVAGGVAANQYLGGALSRLADKKGFTLHVPPPALCTDNAVMIGWAGVERLLAGQNSDSLLFEPKPRWPLAKK